MARRTTAMTGPEAAAFLEAGRNLQVATLGPEGFPHLTTLWYYVEAGRIRFRSFSRSQRMVNLRRDPRLTVLVETGADYADLRGVMVQGTASVDADRHAVLDAYWKITAKYQEPDVTREAVEAMFGRYVEKNAVVTVEPVRIISWDHTKLGGSY